MALNRPRGAVTRDVKHGKQAVGTREEMRAAGGEDEGVGCCVALCLRVYEGVARDDGRGWVESVCQSRWVVAGRGKEKGCFGGGELVGWVEGESVGWFGRFGVGRVGGECMGFVVRWSEEVGWSLS